MKDRFHDNVSKPKYFAESSRKGVDQQSISESNFEQEQMENNKASLQEQQMIEERIHHLIIFTKMQNFFTIMKKNIKYSFNLMKNLSYLQPSKYQDRLYLMMKILNCKANFQKKKFFNQLKNNFVKSDLNCLKALSIMQIALNRKFINQKVFSFQQLKTNDQHQKSQVKYSDQDQKSVEQKINDYLIEIVKVYMVITVKNLQRFKQSLTDKAFQCIKQYSYRKSIHEKNKQIEEKYISKIKAIIKIEQFELKNSLRFKMRAFQTIHSKGNPQRNKFSVRSAERQNQNEKQEENPQVSMCISSIKSMIVSLNKSEHKAKWKGSTQKKKQAVLLIQTFMDIKLISLKRSSFYEMFNTIEYELQRDKLEVLEREVMALKEDIQDI